MAKMDVMAAEDVLNITETTEVRSFGACSSSTQANCRNRSRLTSIAYIQTNRRTVLQVPLSLLRPLSSKTKPPSPSSLTYATPARRASAAALSSLVAAVVSAVVLARITVAEDANNSTAPADKAVATMVVAVAARMLAVVLAGAVASAGRTTTSHSATATRPSISALTGRCWKRLTTTD